MPFLGPLPLGWPLPQGRPWPWKAEALSPHPSLLLHIPVLTPATAASGGGYGISLGVVWFKESLISPPSAITEEWREVRLGSVGGL